MNNPDRRPNTGDWLGPAALAVGAIVVLCVCVLVLVAALGYANARRMLASPATAPASTAAPSPTPTPTGLPPVATLPPVTLAPTPDPGSVNSLAVDLPARDRYDLARRFRGVTQPDQPPQVTYHLGDVATFWVDNDDTNQVYQVKAVLAVITDHAYMWVEQGVDYDLAALTRSAERFSQQTYPTDRAYFGSEASPGIDGDPRLHILNTTEVGAGVSGYFYSPSEYPANVVPYSNEKEMFFINIDNTQPGTQIYDHVLAHEFQHMIHWNVDKNEESWMNEGLSELAAFLNGFGPSGFLPYYMNDPGLQLNSWPENGSSAANYGAGFLFNAYFLDRFGQDALRTLVADPANGLDSVDDTLTAINAGLDADQLFEQWTVANLLNDTSGIYGYHQMPDIGTASVVNSVSTAPYDSGPQQVNQYGAEYIELDTPGRLTVDFQGAQQVRVIPANTLNTDGDPSTDDRTVWWSNRGDDSDMTLTRAVDLTGADHPTLTYDTWYWIEDRWDYGYLVVSTDGGQTWAALSTPHTTTDDPHGNAYGPGYTGQSAFEPDANPEGWLHESVDLSAYAGQQILLRFEMITDDAVNQPGLAVDNICIQAINWCDDAESGDGGWQAQGFARTDNVLAQHFSVQAVVPAADGSTAVVQVPLDATNHGTLPLTVDANHPATLIISGLARHTTEPADYRLRIQPGG